MNSPILSLVAVLLSLAVPIMGRAQNPESDPVQYCSGHDPRTNPNDVMVRVGPLCVDKYEASVWSHSNGRGTLYPQGVPRFPVTFPENGNWTVPLYATSKAGTAPARFITWFQAQQACALAGKRLLTNAEWQMAAAGTPDPGAMGDGVTSCNTNTTGPLLTGSSAACVSKWGASDMVGNVHEWVADWIQGPGASAGAVVDSWIPGAYTKLFTSFGDDYVGGVNDAFYDRSPQTGEPGVSGVNPLPAAIFRGGLWSNGEHAGVFMLDATKSAASLNNGIGFRCGKPAPYQVRVRAPDPPKQEGKGLDSD